MHNWRGLQPISGPNGKKLNRAPDFHYLPFYFNFLGKSANLRSSFVNLASKRGAFSS